MCLERIVQKRELVLDAFRDFRKWYEDDVFAEDRMMRDEIDNAIWVVKEL